MITVTERADGTRRVSVSFPEDEVVRRRFSDDRKAFYDDYVSRSKTKPEFANQVDLPKIMAKYDKTGIIDPLLYRDMVYGDFTNGNDFAEMSMRVKDAMMDFQNLPAELRQFFNHDPAALLNFLAEPKNDEKAIELGLRKKPVMRQERQGDFIVIFQDDKEVKRVKEPAPVPGQPTRAPEQPKK